MVANSALTLDWGDSTTIQAYADDFVLIIKAQSRKQLESKVEEAVRKFKNWTTANHLELSEHKTAALVYGKKKQSLRRQPIFKIGSWRIPTVNNMKYLGVILSNNGRWHEHIKYIKRKAYMKTKNLFRMAGKTWGINSKLLKIWYETTTERTLTYAAAIWSQNANVHEIRHLISAQRPFLLQMSRGYKNLSNVALQVITGIVPIDLKVIKLAKQAKLIQLGLDLPEHEANKYESKPKFMYKNPTEDEIYKYLAEPAYRLDTVIYTDGSKLEGKVGSAFVVYSKEEEKLFEISTWQRRLDENNSVFQAELLAIKHAIAWSNANCLTATAILTDSESSIAALKARGNENKLVNEIKDLLPKSIASLTLKWVKAHAGVEGNERADQLAKEAALKDNILEEHILWPVSKLKREMKQEMLDAWQNRWSTSEKGRDLFRFMPKVETKRLEGNKHLTEFFTGHGPFASVLHRHGLTDSPYCVCGQLADPLHYATACPLTRQWHIHNMTNMDQEEWLHTWETNKEIKDKLINITRFAQENEHQLIAVMPGLLSPSPSA